MTRRGTARIALVAWTVGLLAGVAVLPASSTSLRTVSSGNYWFADDATGSRSEIRVNVGDQIRVTHTGPGRHTVDVDELGIHSGPFTDGQSFTTPALDTPGTFRFYCDTHEGRGHLTTLVVVGQAPPPPEPTPEPTPTPAPAPEPNPEPTAPSTPAPAPEPTSSSAPAPAPTAAPGPATSPAPADPAAPAGTSTPRDEPGDVDPDGAPPTDATTTDDEGGAGPDDPAPEPDGLADAPVASGISGPGGVAGDEPAPWTRGVRLALLALVPMVGAVGWSLTGASGSRRRSD